MSTATTLITLGKRHYEALAALELNQGVFGYSQARLIREVADSYPDYVTVTDNEDDLDGPDFYAQLKGPGVDALNRWREAQRQKGAAQ